MKIDINNHPCFNDEVRHKYGRVHLPIAPRCNIQCNFCNRKFDCVNESRPGVSSAILSPEEAVLYLDKILQEKTNIKVVGIAGPGEPFANPIETMETLRLINEKHPELILCVSSNGLNILPYIDEMAELNISHVTITVNAIDPVIAAKIYSWIRYEKRIRSSSEGVKILLENQLNAIKKLKEKKIIVKVNSIIIPGINDHHFIDIAGELKNMDVDILNCIPLYHNPDSNFANIKEPSKKLIAKVRKEAGMHIKQMFHCTRCRADAVGLLGVKINDEIISYIKKAKAFNSDERVFINPEKPNIAVASNEGVLINKHLGEAEELLIYGNEKNSLKLLETRKTPEKGGGSERWRTLAKVLTDCSYLLVNGIGENPKAILKNKGIKVIVLDGMIEDAVNGIFNNKSINHLLKRKITVCGQSCSNSGGGCG